MRLIDCFTTSFAYTLDVITQAENNIHSEINSVQSHIISLLDSLKGIATEGGYSEKQYQLALFAAVTFIDEKLVSSKWDKRKEWSRKLLQKRYFDTSNGGVEFFSKLDKLNPFNPAERDIREVYYYSLSLGFAGKFYGEGSQSAIGTIKQDNYHLLVDEGALSDNVLFPNAFARKKTEGIVHLGKDFSSLLYGGPILVLVISFFYFKKELMDLANFLVISV
ncbi:MAG: type VI secretion system protein ImpK [Flavobacteriales bacterium]|jgi:type VI secretion system protein ImpK